MKFKILIVAFVLLVSVSMAAEYTKSNTTNDDLSALKQKVSAIDLAKEKIESKKKRLDAICESIIENGPIKPIARGSHVWAGKKTEWCANNFVRVDGWQLSGKSKIALDDDFNVRRIKVGLISPEIYGDKLIRMHRDDISRDEFVKWKEMETSAVIGASISWRF